jgi:hypothetical protein
VSHCVWLLCHAIDVKPDGHVQTGGPLHADVTAFLLGEGRRPQPRPCDGMTVVGEAGVLGRWLAARDHARVDRAGPLVSGT